LPKEVTQKRSEDSLLLTCKGKQTMVHEEQGAIVLTYEIALHETAKTRASPEVAARLVKQLFAGPRLKPLPI
jgi:hypothetical protein